MTLKTGIDTYLSISGLSTDTKPIGPELQNAAFYETDTGRMYRYFNAGWVLYNARVQISDNGANVATNTPFGSMLVSTDPSAIFFETFDGAAIDTTNKWTTGGTVIPTAPGGGTAAINPGTTANASSSLVTQPTFVPSTYELIAVTAQFEATAYATGNHRFWGIGTQPGSWTSATPLQDAIGYEIDTNGIFRASIYASGTRIATQVLTSILDGLPHALLIHRRPGVCLFSIDQGTIFSATLFGNSSIETLPMRAHSINGGSTTVGTPTFAIAAAGFLDFTKPASATCDGIYPWRRQKIGQAGDTFTNNAIGSYPQPTNVAYAATTDTALSAANANRRQYIVSNDTTAKLYILIDPAGSTAASATSYTYIVPAGGTFEMPNPISTARVRGFWAAGGAGTAAVTDISQLTTAGGA